MLIQKSLRISLLLIPLFILLPACSGLQAALPEPGTITGRIFCDCNQDGDCNQNELGLPDARVRLYSQQCTGTPLQTVTTDAQGFFTFEGVQPGQYCVIPDIDPVCGGYAGHMPTTDISRIIDLTSKEVLDLVWFGYTPYVHK